MDPHFYVIQDLFPSQEFTVNDLKKKNPNYSKRYWNSILYSLEKKGLLISTRHNNSCLPYWKIIHSKQPHVLSSSGEYYEQKEMEREAPAVISQSCANVNQFLLLCENSANHCCSPEENQLYKELIFTLKQFDADIHLCNFTKQKNQQQEAKLSQTSNVEVQQTNDLGVHPHECSAPYKEANIHYQTSKMPAESYTLNQGRQLTKWNQFCQKKSINFQFTETQCDQHSKTAQFLCVLDYQFNRSNYTIKSGGCYSSKKKAQIDCILQVYDKFSIRP
jgi:hypothetical protein